jgi:hypothetical protein
MSPQAIHLEHVQQAIDFAEAARATMRQLATPRGVAMQACAHAAGNSHRSQQALDDDAAALSSAGDGEPDPDWLDFDEGGYWGHGCSRLP